MKLLRNLALTLIMPMGLCASQRAAAQTLRFEDLTSSDVNKVFDEVTANFHHTSVSGAGTLGRIFGFEIGLLGGLTKTPEIGKLVKQSDASADADQLPHGTLLGVLTVPFGLTAEVSFTPKIGNDDFKFERQSVGLKWTLTELLLSDLPVSLGLKLHYTQMKASFDQTISGQATQVKLDDSILGVQALVSKNFAIVEPYVGLGWLSYDGKMDVGLTGTDFFSFTSASSASAQRAGLQILAGAEVKLLVIKLGGEYSRQFDSDRYTIKLAGYF